jgi:ATP-dependent helicase Lhr and Lhr-like helicase
MIAFHHAVSRWFSETLGAPTVPQAEGWPHIQAGAHTLIAAPTGSGKTLAAFLCAIDALVREGAELPDETRVLYVSPLKALGNDIAKNLEAPLAGIRAIDPTTPPIRTAVRTGDTPSAQRTAMTKKPPHIFVTTPESLYIMLTSEGGRRMLRTVRTVIVDEIHAVVESKRGSHLALSLERLEALVRAEGSRGENPLQRVGLSATQKPIDEVARFLVGTRAERCAIVDAGHRRSLELTVEVPPSPLDAVMSGEVWEELYDRIAELVAAHRTTLVFVNTRRLAERLARHLSDRIGEEAVTAHHGSLAKEHRLDAEQRLKAGELRALVATASLELGIDIGDVDLVCQVGTCRSFSAFLQRVGRSGHQLGGLSKGRLFPLSRDELVEAVALVEGVRRGELDTLSVPPAPLDILAQQIVAATAAEPWDEDALFALVRRAWPYRALSRETFDAVVQMLHSGYATSRGPRAAHLHRDGVGRRLMARRGARIAAVTSGGAIPDVADYEVVLEPAGLKVGTLNEDFAIESMAGDVFQLGNVAYRIQRVEAGTVRVEDARGQAPGIPFWLGEGPGRSTELSEAVSRLRRAVERRLDEGADLTDVADSVARETGVDEAAAVQAIDYLAATRAALGALPTTDRVIAERFFDEVGNNHLVIHAPFGSRINRAWGLALRKRFCRTFNFELQAAANDDAIVLSLGPTHSFPLEEVWSFLRAATVREVLVQALLDAPVFNTRWRWNATRALSVLRFRGGKKVPAPLLRMNADDLLTVCFPDQVACLENIAGDREIPDHPLVQQTVADCLEEWMDIAGLETVLARIEAGAIELVCRDTTEPSPLAAEVLNARPYAFLDDAPLEERRTRAVQSRRWLDPATASDLGALDPEAIARVESEAWPEVRDVEELHDALCMIGAVTDGEMAAFVVSATPLSTAGRVTRLQLLDGRGLWVAAERLAELVVIHPSAGASPVIAAVGPALSRDEALVALLRGRLAASGPVAESTLARDLGLDAHDVAVALATLESEGYAMRGHFRAAGLEWCERRLLARIHRYTLGRLRREIEPVSAAVYLRFLLRWQHVSEPLAGVDGLAAILDQLAGLEIPAAAWEASVLPARCRDFDPRWLDALTLSGRYGWVRRRDTGASRLVRATPMALVPRSELGWHAIAESAGDEDLTAEALAVGVHLGARGASFFDEIARGVGLSRAATEDALGRLAAAGRVTSDGFAGLRALLLPASRQGALRRATLDSAGRWSLVPAAEAADVEAIARRLLLRWGVVTRRILVRETGLPPWRDLLRCYRRLEARGEIRGGRFVAGLSGEQYALPEAVGLIRKERRRDDEALVELGPGDPLDLVGIVLPGPSGSDEGLALQGGIPRPEARGPGGLRAD